MSNIYEQPSKPLRFITAASGVIVAFATIAGLQNFSTYVKQFLLVKAPDNTPDSIAQKDIKSIRLPGDAVTSSFESLYKTVPKREITSQQLVAGRFAWEYFQRNWNKSTGLVNSADGYSVVTMADQADGIAGLVSAYELGIVTKSEFDENMSTLLRTLAKLPLYQTELPNKLYNAKTGIPVNYGTNKRQEIGWSALDIGRLAIWLKIVGNKYPEFRASTKAVWNRWHVDRLTKNGQLYSTALASNKENYYQDGHLGYENYAAYGLKIWGLKVDKSLDSKSKTGFVNLYGKGVPFDNRVDKGTSNFVESTPYILDGIETGFQALPKAYADRVLAAQEARYQATTKLTAVSADSLDKKPYFINNTLFVNNQPWLNTNNGKDNYTNLRFLSASAAIGWDAIYGTKYTQELSKYVNVNLATPHGFYSGFYEALNQPNKSLTAKNNGMILESLLYIKVGQPLLVWSEK